MSTKMLESVPQTTAPADTTAFAIEMIGLCKSFGKLVAVDHLTQWLRQDDNHRYAQRTV
jgi:hypothetical protein